MPKGQFTNPKERARKIANKAKRGKYFNCLVCKKEFWRKPYDIKKGNNKFCSKTCYFKWQIGKDKKIQNPRNQNGKNNPNWKGGIGGVNKIIRQSNKYKNWRKTIFKRDDWTCQKCGIKSKKNCFIRIEAHHIKPFVLFPKLRFKIDNGLTLCKKCHNKEPKGKEILCIK